MYRNQKSESAKPRVVHYNRLKPYHGDYDNWLDNNVVISHTGVQISDNDQITVSDNELTESEHSSDNEQTDTVIDYGRGKRVKRSPERYMFDD